MEKNIPVDIFFKQICEPVRLVWSFFFLSHWTLIIFNEKEKNTLSKPHSRCHDVKAETKSFKMLLSLDQRFSLSGVFILKFRLLTVRVIVEYVWVNLRVQIYSTCSQTGRSIRRATQQSQIRLHHFMESLSTLLYLTSNMFPSEREKTHYTSWK